MKQCEHMRKVLSGPWWEWRVGCVLRSGHVVVDVCRKYGVTTVTTSEIDKEAATYVEWVADFSPAALDVDIYEPATVGILRHLAQKRWGDEFGAYRVTDESGAESWVEDAGAPHFCNEEDLLWDALIPAEVHE